MVLRREIREKRMETWNGNYAVNLVWGRRIPRTLLKRFSSMCRRRKVNQIIDAGCGSGVYTSYFSLQGFNVVAMDVSRSGLTLTKHLVNSLSFLRLSGAIDAELHGADLMNGELPHFPVASGKAQAVFVNYTLHQLTHTELAVCIAEFRRILRQEGILLIHEPCSDELVAPSEAVEVLEDGSLFLKNFGVVNWNLTRDQLSKMMHNSFNVLSEERLEEDGKSKVVFILEKAKVS